MNLTTVPARQDVGPGAARGGEVPADVRGVVVVAVEGDVDLYSGPDLKQAFTDLLASPDAGRGDAGSSTASDGADRDGPSGTVRAVIVDLTAVEFIDSYAVGVLVQGHHLARRSGRGYALVATHPMIHKLFEITGLARVLPLHPDVASAVAGLHAARAADSAVTAPSVATGDVPGGDHLRRHGGHVSC